MKRIIIAGLAGLMIAFCGILEARTRADSGRLMAGRAERPPVIDGVLDDECWGRSVELHPFVLIASSDQAEDQTRAYVTYDSENLYVAFRCDEFALDPVNNILHEFSMETVEDNDDGIFRDDAAALLLDPGDGMIYDIFVNARGAVNSAAGERADSWGTRDNRWGEGIEAEAKVGNGYWAAEVRIPFKLLGGSPGEGDVWGICLGRLQRRTPERSSWQPMAAGFHMPEYFGEVVFGRHVPGITISKLWDYSLGENEIGLSIDPAGRRTPVRIESSVEYPGERRQVSRSNIVLSEAGEITHEYRLARDGEVNFRYSVVNPATFQTYYRSPAHRGRVSVTELRLLKAEAEADYSIYLNGIELNDGASLYQGINVLAVETGGRMRAEFGVGDNEFGTGGGWRYSASAPGGWNSRDYSDSGWSLAAADEDGMIGRSGEKGYYRRVVLLNHSMFWPNWEMEGLWVAENSIQQMFLAPQGVKGYNIEDYSFYMEVPEEFGIIGASSYYDHLPSLSARHDGGLEREGRRYSRYLVSTSDRVGHRENIPLHNYAAIGVELPESGKEFEVRDAGPFYYYLQADNGAIMEIPQTLQINILPPLRGKQPQTYHWHISGGWLSRMNDKELQRRILSALPDCGLSGINFSEPMPEGIPLRNLRFIDFNTWNLDMRPYLAENPGHALLDNEGLMRHAPDDGRRNHVCTTRLLENSRTRDFVNDAVKGFIERARPAIIDWDYESSVWSSYISCYCEHCLKRFRESAGIPEDAKLNPDIIRGEHPGQWTDFMCMRMAMLAETFYSMIKEIDPGIIFTVYSGYQSERTRVSYGVDWRYLTGKIDKARAGYGRPLRELQDTLDALGDTPLVLGAIARPYRVTERQYPDYISKARILRRAVDGTGGVLLYTLASFSGRTFYASAEISRLVAEYEDIFVANRRADDLITVSGISAADTAVLTDGSTRIVILFNEGNTPRRAKVGNKELPSGAGVYDYYGEKDLGRAESLETEIAPGDVKVYIVK